MADGNASKIMKSIRDEEGNTFIQSLLDEGLDVNARNLDNNRTTMLSYAAACGNVDAIEFLLQKGADGNVTNSDGSKPLHIAAVNGHTDIVNIFLNLGVFVDSRDHNGSTPLHSLTGNIPVGARESYQELIHILVNNDADINTVNRSGCTPLLTAAQNYSWDIVDLFIKLGANVECCDRDKWTVLHYSCRNGWSRIVRSLVEGRFNIDLNVRNSDNNTPLIIAAEFQREDIVSLLIASKANIRYTGFRDKTVLHYACEAGWLDVVQSLINKRCNMNAKDYEGNTPLIIAINRLHKNVVTLLIESEANVLCVGLGNRTLLHSACKAGWLDVVVSLVSKGCDPNAETSDGNTPVILACFAGRAKLVNYLVESGVNLKCRSSNDGWTVLHFACKSGWPDVVKSIVKKGFDVNVINGNAITSLHLAVMSGDLEIVEDLLKAGADCNVKNRTGKTAFNEFVQNLLSLDGMILFIENGAYFHNDDYAAISEEPLFKEGILQNIKLCTQAVINKFNNADLPRICNVPGVSEILPSIEMLKIASNTKVAWHIAQSVEHEIEMKGYCNVLNVRPITLSILSARFLVEHFDSYIKS